MNFEAKSASQDIRDLAMGTKVCLQAGKHARESKDSIIGTFSRSREGKGKFPFSRFAAVAS